ncbi:MAG TPA: peptidoglycan-binding domain-containing protein, partial [Acidimicrobiales bacterium]|nr:peptidoglycan-binding domain-containing protein [Acidimicrobiales bacterium]
QGEVPMYRDLRPGDTGADVRQLEEALVRLGFPPGRVDGTYDVSTEAAVDAWYDAAGYAAQGPTDEQRDALRAARAALSSAEDRSLQAEESLEKASQGVTPKDVAMAEAEVRAAQRERARAGDELDAARADAASAAAAAVAATAEEDATRRRAEEQVAAAQAAVADAERVVEAAADGPDKDAAESALQQARRALDEARRSGEGALANAAASTRQAEEIALKATRDVPDAARMVEAADDKLTLARVSLETLRTPPDTTTARAMAAKAERDLADARRQLSELDGEVGVVVPADEVLFFPALPLRVDEPKVVRGDDGTKEVMVASTSRLAIDASVSIPDAALVKVGDRAAVRSTELGIEVTGIVSELASKPGTDGVDAQKVYMEVVPEEPPAELTGSSVRLSIAVRSTGGDVLAVPVAALSVDSDGASRVQVAEAGGRTRTVAVEPGLSAQGFVEVTPTGGKLAVGDRVVVGTSSSGRSGSGSSAAPSTGDGARTSAPPAGAVGRG